MVKGIDIFRKHFEHYSDKYVLIGGVACYLAHNKAGLDFRATKDFDIVLLIEKIDREFSTVFMDFIRKGKYIHIEKSTKKKRFYRFYKPETKGFPFMLELFTKMPDILNADLQEQNVVKIINETEVLSLSAILMLEEYYDFIKNNIIEISGIPIVNEKILIPLKARAYLDLIKRKELGESIDSHDIKKHKNDVFRLFRLLDPLSKVELNETIKMDMLEFINKVSSDEPDLKNLGIKNFKFIQIINFLKNIFILE